MDRYRRQRRCRRRLGGGLRLVRRLRGHHRHLRSPYRTRRYAFHPPEKHPRKQENPMQDIVKQDIATENLELGMQELEAMEAPGFWSGFKQGVVISGIAVASATLAT
ncbi:predicted protein [Streptomyces sp. C]|nr:predicted protein [Streptomyces sp. C]